MDDFRTQRYDAEDEAGYDWEYAEAPPPPRILWGRVAAAAGAALLFFLIGRGTANQGVSEEQYQAARRRLAQAQQEVNRLQDEVRAAQQATEQNTNTDEDAADRGRPATAADARVYTVRSGDTLTTIAQKFYRDPDRAELIAQVNNIDDPSEIEVGDELLIPNVDETDGNGGTDSSSSN